MTARNVADGDRSRRDFFSLTGAGVGAIALVALTSKGMAAAQVARGTTTEDGKVLEANRNFYSALEALSLEKMDAVWLREDWVTCVHPGWNLLEGWKTIRESWQAMFKVTDSMLIRVGVQAVRVDGSTAWVCCTEDISSTRGRTASSGSAQATNIFERRNDAWFLVHHHASLIPIP